jgi:hypothetical protein
MDKVSVNFNRHFTDSDVSQNRKRKLDQEKLLKLKQEQTDTKSKYDKKQEENLAESIVIDGKKNVEIKSGETVKDAGGDVINASKEVLAQKERARKFDKLKNSNAAAELSAKQKSLELESAATLEAIGNADKIPNRETNYSESNNTADNIYNLNITKKEFIGEGKKKEIITKADDTINRINTMKRSLI